jgi:PAS domain S-box-containing protein
VTARCVLVRSTGGDLPSWAPSLGCPELAVAGLAQEGRTRLREAECALVDGSEGDAVGVVRRIHALSPALQVVLVSAPESRAPLQHALLFTPGVGEVWFAAPEEVHPDLVERAAAVTRQRRRYQATRAEIERSTSASAPPRARRALISDAFLANLLQTIPDPVLSIDAAGAVLSWNPAAERVLGYPAAEAVGRDVSVLLSPHDPAPLRRMVAAAVAEPVRAEVSFRTREGETGIGEVTVSPVAEAGEGIRSVILHDLTEVRRAQAELEAQAAELEEQAAELEVLNDELQTRTRELEDAMCARSRFYAAMSHELRTPINAIIGYNSLILDEILGPLAERQKQGLQRSQRAAHHLLELVNDVLDLAKIEAGRIELQGAPTELPAFLEEILDTVRSLADQHGSTLLLEGDEGTHTVVSDPRRVRQILLNLLSNAIKFGEGKPIRVAWERTPDGGVEVHVHDRGRGIAPEHLQRIFHEFEQVEPGTGTGLGLPISLRLAQLLGGSLRVASRPGEGSTFTLSLPAALPAADGPAA